MKKLTLVLLVIASLILGAMAFASCDASDLPFDLPIDLPFLECDHEYVEEVTKAATCTEEGAKKLTCSKCDEVVEEVIPALGHDFAAKFTTDVAATCKAEGSKSKHCSRCDAVTEVTVIAKAEHTWAETYTVDVEKTCTENGQKSKHCTECDAIDEESIVIDYKSGHVLDLAFSVDTAKTCTTAGWESIHCQNCDYTEQGREIPASHNWNEEYTADVLFGCTTDGSESIHCADCTETKDSRVVKAHHVFADGAAVTKAPSFYATGLKTGTCVNCQQPMSEELPKTEITVISNANKNNINVGSVTASNWAWVVPVKNLMTDETKYWPTATDPDGNAVVIEFSALMSDKFEITGGDSVAFYMMKGSTHTQLGSLDAYHDDFPDAAGIWVKSQTQTGMIPEIPAGGTQQAYRVEDGWHRFGAKLKQVIIAKDAQDQVLEMTAGQLAHPETDTIASITYKWICEFYVDGVLARTGFYEGIAAGDKKPGIFDATNLLYTATVSEDGKVVTYEPGNEASAFNVRLDSVLKDSCTEELPVADLIATCGKDFVQKVTVVPTDFNGGKPAYNYKVNGSEFYYPNYCHYQIDSADPNPEFVAKKKGFIFTGWVDGVAQYELPLNHTEHTPDIEGETILYTASIFAEGKKSYTCDICSEVIEETILQKTPSTTLFVENRKDGSFNDLGSTNFDLYKKNSTYNAITEDFMVEFTVLYNESFAQDTLGTEGDTKLNFRPFKNGSDTIASLNLKTGNFFVDNCQAADIANGISKPDVMLVPGWHRLALQFREEITFDGDTPNYAIKIRIFVDGVMMNDPDTWSYMTASKAANLAWVTAKKNAETGEITYTTERKFDNMARWGDLWRTADSIYEGKTVVGQTYRDDIKVNHYGFVVFDDAQAYFKDKVESDVYSEIFKVDVTPLDVAHGTYSFGGNKVVFDLDGGAFPQYTAEGTKVLPKNDEEPDKYVEENTTYTTDNIIWFQITGAKTLLPTAPTKDGFTFAGWGEGVVDKDAVTVTYKAKWEAVHAHDFEEKTVYAATVFSTGLKQTICKECGWLVKEETVAMKQPDTVIVAENHGDGTPKQTNFDLYKKSSTYNAITEDFMVEFSFLYNESYLSKAENNGDVKLNIRPFKSGSDTIATLNIKTGNFYVDNCQDANIANGISKPDVMLTPGWHRLALQFREEITFDGDTPNYAIKIRLFVDGVMMNETGTWAYMLANKAQSLAWVTAAKNGETITYTTAHKYDNMGRLGDLWRTNTDYVNYYGFTMIDNVQFYFTEPQVNSEVYNEIFKTKVTPLDTTRGTYKFGENKIVLDLNGGKFSTVTVNGTQLDTKENGYAELPATYTAVNTPWFQIAGAKTVSATPTRRGYEFVGWSAGVVDAEAKTVTYKAIWKDASIFSYVTKEDWTNHEGMTVADNHAKCEWATPGGKANGQENNEAMLSIGGKKWLDIKVNAAEVAVSLETPAKYYIVTASFKGTGCIFADINLVNGTDPAITVVGTNGDKGTVVDQSGTAIASTSDWVDVKVIIDVDNEKLIYYVNDQFVSEISGTVVTNITAADIYVGYVGNNGRLWIKNFTLSTGK